MGIKRKLVVSNVLWNFLSFALTLVISFYLARFILSRLGPVNYGLWVLIGSLLGYTGLLDLGISSAIVRHVGNALAQDNQKKVSDIIVTSILFFTAIGSIVFLICLLVSKAGHSFFHVPEDMKNSFSILLVLLGGGVAFSFPGRVFLGVLRALERFDILNLIQIVQIVLQLFFIVILLKEDIIVLGIIFSSLNILVHLTYMVVVKIILPDIHFVSGRFSVPVFRTIGEFGLFAFLIILGDQFRFYTDSMVLGYFIGPATITVFYFGNRIVEYSRDIMGKISGPFFPLFSRQNGEGDQKVVLQTFLISSRVAAIMACLLVGFVIGSGYHILHLWVGDKIDTVSSCYTVLLIIALPTMVSLAQVISINYLYGVSRHHFLAVLTLFEGLSNLVLSILLVTPLGVVGVALGTAVPMLVTKGVIQPVFVCRCLGILMSRYAVRCLLTPLFFGFVFICIQVLIYQLIRTVSWMHVSGVAIFSSMIMLPLVYYLFFTESERERLWATYRQWRRA